MDQRAEFACKFSKSFRQKVSKATLCPLIRIRIQAVRNLEGTSVKRAELIYRREVAHEKIVSLLVSHVTEVARLRSIQS